MKIFFGAKTFYLADNSDVLLNNKNKIILPVHSYDELKKAYEKSLNDTKSNHIVFLHNDLITLKGWFVSMFTLIEAAGGLVINDKKEFLLIFRKGKWDLPKGKLEQDETIENAAIREAEEECGISGLTISKQIPATYHIYLQDGKTVLKPSYWFEMHTTFTGVLIPQLQEGITKAEWVKKENVAVLLPNTYESIREVMANYL